MSFPENINEESSSLSRKRAAPLLPRDANNDDDSDDDDSDDDEALPNVFCGVQLFNVEILKQRLEQHFLRIENEKIEPTVLPISNIAQTYKIKGGFARKDRYWDTTVKLERFEGSEERGILYRPEIVAELLAEIEKAFCKRRLRGVLVRGPEGIGKSHSLVNLVRKLLYDSNGKYLVTFIVTCQEFKNVENLYDSVCSSFGSTTEELEFQSLMTTRENSFHNFVSTIAKLLKKKDKQWVLIFDQINRLFARPTLQSVRDLGALPFPFCAITDIMKAGRITSIVSASANNELSYRRSQPGFEDYDHCLSMNEDEVALAFAIDASDEKEKERLAEIYQATGGVPLQVENVIERFGSNVDAYERDGFGVIRNGLLGLRRQMRGTEDFQGVSESAVLCVLALSTENLQTYDRKYSVYDKEAELYLPVYPLVTTAYKDFFWDSLMKYVDDNEQRLLNVCKKIATTNDTRGRLLEQMVINRCLINAEVTPSLARRGNSTLELPVCKLVERFKKQKLPTDLPDDGIYVPLNPTFPAIDFIWKGNRTVWGVQVHVAGHADVSLKFKSMCLEAQWQDKFDKIYLLYLGPEQWVADLNLKPSTSKVSTSTDIDSIEIEIVRAAKDDLTCLRNLQWPNRCSLPP